MKNNMLNTIEEKRAAAKNWLNEYRYEEDHVKALVNRAEETLTVIEYATEHMEHIAKVDSSYEEFREEHKCASQLKEMLKDAVADLYHRCEAVIRAVEDIPMPEVRRVISDYYYKNMPLKAIASDMGVSLSKVKYLHRLGLDWIANEHLAEINE